MIDTIVSFVIFSLIITVVNVTAMGWLNLQMAKFLYKKIMEDDSFRNR